MKKRFLFLIILCLTLLIFPACEAKADSTLKEITHPYIDEYELVEGRYGDKNILDDFEYVKIVLIDTHEYEVHIKPKTGDKKVYKGTYSVNEKTRELTADSGILGYGAKENVYIKDGGFMINMNIFYKPLYLKFEAK